MSARFSPAAIAPPPEPLETAVVTPSPPPVDVVAARSPPPGATSLCVLPPGMPPVMSMRSVCVPELELSTTTGRSQWTAFAFRPVIESVFAVPPVARVEELEACRRVDVADVVRLAVDELADRAERRADDHVDGLGRRAVRRALDAVAARVDDVALARGQLLRVGLVERAGDRRAVDRRGDRAVRRTSACAESVAVSR